MKTIASLAAAIALAAAAGPVSAQEARIAWGDLDMGSAPGADTFDSRVDTAARTLCRGVKRLASRISDRPACQAAARAEALRQLPGRIQVEYARSRRSITL